MVATAHNSRRARTWARRSAVQALYQWFLTERPMTEIIAEFEQERKELKKAGEDCFRDVLSGIGSFQSWPQITETDEDYFRDVLSGISANAENIRNTLAPLLDRSLHELDPVTRAVLYLGMYELIYQPELPWRVVLNEAVELAHRFGAEASHKYINGVLDQAAPRLRPESAADNSARGRAGAGRKRNPGARGHLDGTSPD